MEVDNQVAATTETRTPNCHRAKIAHKESGWEEGDRSGPVERKQLRRRKKLEGHKKDRLDTNRPSHGRSWQITSLLGLADLFKLRLAKESLITSVAIDIGGINITGSESMAKESKESSKISLKRKKYETELRSLRAKLCKLQDWIKYERLRVIVVFEGRDAAGKGGTIRAMTERVSSRVFRLAAFPAPSAREKTQMYFQRYMEYFLAAG